MRVASNMPSNASSMSAALPANHALPRCQWCAAGDAAYIAYHDNEWGVPVHDDRRLFELLVLEGAQAGLSWRTILNKRESYRAAFAGFDPVAVAAFDQRDVERLLANPGIVRNRAKIESTLLNARLFIDIQDRFSSFDAYLWRYVEYSPIQNQWHCWNQVPASSIVSDALSKDLKERGFKFVGTTIMYAFMQAAGMINDHTTNCYRWKQLRENSNRH